MKKIIAAAVATAFVAPAFAADVSVSGYYELSHVSVKDSSADSAQDLQGNESFFVIKADEELENGMKVGADFSIKSNGDHYSGSSLYVSGAFGKIEGGDTSGAIDGIDDKTDVFFVYDNGTGVTSKDADFSWDLPALVDGLAVRAAYSTDDATETDNTSYAITQYNLGTDPEGLVGLSAKYSIADTGATVAYGREDINNDTQKINNTFYQITYAGNGLTLAYENGKSEDEASGTVAGTENTTMSAKYDFNGVVVKYGSKKVEDTDAGTISNEYTAYGAEYTVGGATFFAERAEDGKGDKDELTAVGVAFKF